jgi:iron complex transport system substrate-binding protein
MTRAPALLMFIALAAVPARAEEPPRKIASINLCGDQFLIALAQPQQIGGISAFSLDPTLSVMPTQARAHPILNQRSESAIAMQPDLVLAGPHERSALRRAVEQLGIRVSEVAIISNLEDARAQILRVATFIGQPARGERLAAELDAARRRLAAKRPAHPRTALLIERRGYTAGPESLAAALLREAGFETPRGAPAGLGGFVSLEHVIAMNPDFLVTYEASEQARDQGELFLTHPALRALFPPERRFVFPRRYSLCGGPALVEALDYLAEHQLGKM